MKTAKPLRLSKAVRHGMVVAKWGRYLIPYNSSKTHLEVYGIYNGPRRATGLVIQGREAIGTEEHSIPAMVIRGGVAEALAVAVNP